MLRLAPNEHEKISFDCQNFRSARLQELRLATDVAAERVRKTGIPYAFAPMSSRERRILHLAMRDLDDLRTESDGEAASATSWSIPRTTQASRPRRRFRDGDKKRSPRRHGEHGEIFSLCSDLWFPLMD